MTLFSLSFITTELNAQSFDDFGKAHNEYLKEILPQVSTKHKSGNVFLNVLKLTDGKNVKFGEILQEIKSYGDPDALINDFISKKLLDSKTGASFKAFLNLTKNKSADQIVELVETERKKSNNSKTYLNFLSTIKHSAIFWGNNEYRLYLNESVIGMFDNNEGGNNGGPRKALSPRFWKVMACDATGCLAGPQAGGICSTCAAINLYF